MGLLPLLGNRATGAWLQAKLQAGPTHDAHEREAEQAAARVTAAGTGPAAPRATQPGGGGAPSTVPALSGLGPSRPLPAALRARFEPRFGHDFSQVRLHAGPQAAGAARALAARAFTYGHQVAFGAGEYTPESQQGQRLLAHELAHVVQQTGGWAGAGRHRPSLSATGPRLARQPRGRGGRSGGAGFALSAHLQYDRDRDELRLVLDPGASLALPVGQHGLFGLRSPTGLRARLGLGSGQAEVEPTRVHFGITGRRLSLGGATLVAPVLRGTADLPEALRGSFVGQPPPTGFLSNLARPYSRIPSVLSSPVSGLRGSLSATVLGRSQWQYPLSQAWGQTLFSGFAGGRLRLQAEVDQAAGRFRLSAQGRAQIRLEEISSQVEGATAGRLPLGNSVRLELWGNAHLSTDQLPRSLSLADVNLRQLLQSTQVEGGGAIHGQLRVLGIPGRLAYRFRIDASGIQGRAALDFPSGVPFLLGVRGPLSFDFRRGLSADLTTWGLVQLASDEVQQRLAAQEARGEREPVRALAPAPDQPQTPSLGYGVGYLHLRPSGQSYLAVGIGFSRRLYLGAFFRRTF